MKLALCTTLALGVAGSLAAGDLHGKVTCKGVRDSADAVVYVGRHRRQDLPRAGQEHAKIDQKNLVFTPHVLPVLVGTTVDFLNSTPSSTTSSRPTPAPSKFNLGTWPQGQTKQLHLQEGVRGRPCSARSTPRWRLRRGGSDARTSPSTKADGSYDISNVPDGAVHGEGLAPEAEGDRRRPVTVAGAREANFEIAK